MNKRILVIMLLLISALTVSNAQTGTWSGKLDIQGSKLSLVFHLNDENPTMDSPDQGAKGIPVQLEKGQAGKIIVRIPSLGASYEGQWLINRIVGTFKQMNVSLPLTLNPGEDKPKRPQTPLGPFPYETEEVTFANGNVTLEGTLTLPEGYSHNTPALVMITGSGIQNRDEEIFEHKPFAVIADALARAGIATLRYDDRGFNAYSGDLNECTVEDFKNDALAGIRFLRGRFAKVGVIGHSEGGSIAMMLAAEKEADFIVSLAGMAVSGAETLIWQNRTGLIAAGFSEEIADTYCKLLAEAYGAAINGDVMPKTDHKDLPDMLKRNFQAVAAQIRTPYMMDFLSLDVRNLMDRITCPVMALNGTKDIQVEFEMNLAAIVNGLKENSKNIIVPIAGVNHLFQNCNTGAVSEYKEIEETISPAVLEMIVTWLSEFK